MRGNVQVIFVQKSEKSGEFHCQSRKIKTTCTYKRTSYIMRTTENNAKKGKGEGK